MRRDEESKFTSPSVHCVNVRISLEIFQRFKRYTDWYFNISFILHQSFLCGGIFNGNFLLFHNGVNGNGKAAAPGSPKYGLESKMATNGFSF